MKEIAIRKNANSMMWVEYWINKAHPSNVDQEIYAEKYDEFRWICKIDLPLINKTVESISTKEIDSMLNASKKAAILIDEYMKEHPELVIINRFKGKRWEICGDENGRYICSGMSSAWRQEQAKQIQKMDEDAIEAIKKSIKRISKIKGSDNNLFIQVLDHSLFGNNASVNDILKEVSDKIQQEYHMVNLTVYYDKDNEKVIAVGYNLPFKEEELNDEQSDCSNIVN